MLSINKEIQELQFYIFGSNTTKQFDLLLTKFVFCAHHIMLSQDSVSKLLLIVRISFRRKIQALSFDKKNVLINGENFENTNNAILYVPAVTINSFTK